jgi:predicted dehydrogenase
MAVGVAVVGLGWWGHKIARELQTSDLFDVRLGVDPDPDGRDRAEALGIVTASTLEAALDAPAVDAVILCSPHRRHVDQMVAAARAGKHVFCEKPFSDRASEAERALSALQEAGVQVGIGHERRFEPAVLDLRERVRSGDIGTALVFEGNFSQDKFLALPPDNWRLSLEHAPVGPLSATGIHLVDLAIAVLGTPTSVWANLSTRGTAFENGDTLTVSLQFVEGGSASITAVLTTPFIGRVCVIGSQGWVEIRDRSHPEAPTGWDVTTSRRDALPETQFYPPHASVLANLEAFARAVTGEETYPVTIDEIRANVRTFEAITRSVTSGAIEPV